MRYKFYAFEEPVQALLIARGADVAMLEYQEKVGPIQEGVSFDEISSTDLVERFAATTTEGMPTIERGMKHAALEVQESLFKLAEKNQEALVLSVEKSFVCLFEK